MEETTRTDNKRKYTKRRLTISCWDADFIPYYVCNNKKGEPNKTLEDCINLCDNMINSINRLVKADKYIGFLTVGKCFRYKVDKNYKANRKYQNLPNYLKEVKQHMIDNHNFTYNRKWEADDLCVSFKAQYKHFNTIIISPDKDILTSVDIAYNPRKNEFTSTSKEQIMESFWKSMIIGDSVDGIKAIEGLGKVAADNIFIDIKCPPARILKCYIERYGEYKGIEEFRKNYLLLKLREDVKIGRIKLNKVNIELEQTNKNTG